MPEGDTSFTLSCVCVGGGGGGGGHNQFQTHIVLLPPPHKVVNVH